MDHDDASLAGYLNRRARGARAPAGRGKSPTRSARTRRWFGVLLVVVALMVLAAGFFGGALINGIRHYDWP